MVISSNTTEAPIDSSCSGTSGTRTLTVGASLSFAAGQIVLVHQSRGTGAGNWELAKVSSYSGTTLTLESNLVNTYTDSGNDQAQVRVLKQYKSVTINSGITLTGKVWGGDIGGILGFLCSGETNILGTIDIKGGNAFDHPSGNAGGNGVGYTGGSTPGGGDGFTGEGTTGAAVQQITANGNGGGGGDDANNAGGGGGGNGTAGSAGTGTNAGAGGGTAGSADLSTFVFGGGGGSQAQSGTGTGGGAGAGICLIISKRITVSGSINGNGGRGGNSGNNAPTGGGGAGGSVFLKGEIVSVGTNLITATGGAAGTPHGTGNPGGAGGSGRIRIEACERTGSTNPSASEQVGGNEWCIIGGFIF